MRVITTLSDQLQARQLSDYLTSRGIDNQVDVDLNNDWGSEGYGTLHCKLWIIDEDKLEPARSEIEEWLRRNDNSAPIKQEISMTPTPPRQPIGYITFYLLTLCIAIFILEQVSSPTIPNPAPNLPPTPLYSAPVKKILLYDYPQTYTLVDDLVEKYGVSSLADYSALPREGKDLYKAIHKTPWWEGIYPLMIEYIHKGSINWNATGPLWEKEREGQLWRLLTPIFLHGDFFHLLFNMLWLIVLGRQLEQRLGINRYIAFTVIVGIISNTAQYLMSGPNFIGYSGVLCGMLAFIWQRQRLAAWEGYQLDSSTFRLLVLFVGAMAGLQLLSFAAEAATGYDFSPGLANTAHLAGAATGYFLARVPTFALRL